MTTSGRPVVVGSGNLQELKTTDRLNLAGLPTSSAGLSSGDLWIDTGNDNAIKVVP